MPVSRFCIKNVLFYFWNWLPCNTKFSEESMECHIWRITEWMCDSVNILKSVVDQLRQRSWHGNFPCVVMDLRSNLNCKQALKCCLLGYHCTKRSFEMLGCHLICCTIYLVLLLVLHMQFIRKGTGWSFYQAVFYIQTSWAWSWCDLSSVSSILCWCGRDVGLNV